MPSGDQTEGTGASFYPPTLWTQIQDAREGSVACQEAWTVLVERYRGVIRSQIARRIQDDPDNVADEFIAFEFQDLVGKADRSKARFRSLLATALRRFIHSELRRRYALKRGQGRKPVPLETAILDRVPGDAAEGDALAKGLDYGIAEQVFQRAFARVREDEAGRLSDEEFELLLGKDATRPMKDIATRLGISEANAKVRRCRLLGRWREAVRREVADLVAPEDIGDELRYLASVLGSFPLREAPDS